jgi:predicted RNA-binding protein YlxR (DUF448 family)
VVDQIQLVRYVCAPDGEVLVDERNRLPGRGAYTCLDHECIEQAVSKHQFERTFRHQCQNVMVDELLDKIRAELRKRMTNLLGMARKASENISGSNAVLEALGRPGKIEVVILAEDISAGIAEKITRKTKAVDVLTITLFNKGELGHYMGRAERSVVALPEGQLAVTFRNVWERYQAILGEN